MKKIALVALSAFGLVSAAGSLWGPDTDYFPSLQVRVPDVVACWAANPDQEEGNPCYDEGGWWFGYTDQDATTQVKIEGSYVNFGEGTSLTEPALGGSLIENAIDIKFRAGAATSANAPSIAGIGFNYKAGSSANENISSKEGFCISYSTTETLQMELGWDEDTYNYDTWYTELPVSNNKTTKVFKWTGGQQTSKIAGDFKKDDWGGSVDPDYNQPVTKATGEAVSLKIRLKNGTTSEVTADFKLYEFGWAGDGCDGGSSPVISNVVANAGLNLSLSGKMLSMTAKEAAPVQIINLQGAVVHSQVYAPGSKMNLSNLPTGVYMVRVPSLSYSGKIMLK